MASDVPPRPAHLPDDARFVALPAPHWRAGAEEPGSGQPVGLHTSWTAHGEPVRYERYDARGRLLSRHVSHGVDPLVDLAARFRDEPRWFDWHHWVGRYDDAMHTVVARVAADGTVAKRRELAHALTFLDQHRGRSRAFTFPRHDRILALFHAHAPAEERALADPDQRAFTAFALDAMLALGDDVGLNTWGPRWLAFAEAPRPGDQVPPGLRERITRALAGTREEDPVQRAGRRVGRWLHPVLGRPGETATLLVDEQEGAYWLDGESVESVPLVVDATGPSLAPSFAAVGSLSSRMLVAEPGRGMWLVQRYGNGLYLFGAVRTAAAFAIETVVDLFVRCPDEAWAARVAALFEEVRPFPASSGDPFDDDVRPWVREYGADRDHVHARDLRWLGVSGSDLLAAQAPPPRTGLRPAPRVTPSLEVARRCASRAEAIAEFDAEERRLLARGYFIARLFSP